MDGEEDYTTHIRHTSDDYRLRNVSWCGQRIEYRFAFGSIDHAAYKPAVSRLVTCEACISAALRALRGNKASGVTTDPRECAPSDVTKAPLSRAKVPVPGYTRIFSDD